MCPKSNIGRQKAVSALDRWCPCWGTPHCCCFQSSSNSGLHRVTTVEAVTLASARAEWQNSPLRDCPTFVNFVRTENTRWSANLYTFAYRAVHTGFPVEPVISQPSLVENNMSEQNIGQYHFQRIETHPQSVLDDASWAWKVSWRKLECFEAISVDTCCLFDLEVFPRGSRVLYLIFFAVVEFN